MKILPTNKSAVVLRIEFYQPYPPAPGYYTFNGVGNSEEEIIYELYRMKRIGPAYIRDKCILCTVDTITTGLTDYLINSYQEDCHRRQKQQKQNMDDYLKRNPTKPLNSVVKENDAMIYSVL